MAATVNTREVTREEQVIAAARATRDAMTGLEVELLLHAVAWVELHPGEEVDTSVEWGCGGAGDRRRRRNPRSTGRGRGFALAIGHSTDSGRRYLGTRSSSPHRLPGSGAGAGWEVAVEGPPDRQATASLPAAGCGGRRSGVVLLSPPGAPMRRSTGRSRRPARSTTRLRPNAMGRGRRSGTKTHLGAMTYDGLVPITAMADVPDAVAFEDYVATEAAGMDPASRSRSAGRWCWDARRPARRYAR